MNWIQDLITNPLLIGAISAWFVAQTSKVIIYAIVNKKFDISRFFGDGGMPSAHSATVTSLATMSGLYCGLNSSEFAICAILAFIVCRDAMGVRLETGKQAAIIKEIVQAFEELTSQKKLPEIKLKEFVGHTPIQVMVGTFVGLANAIIVYNIFFI